MSPHANSPGTKVSVSFVSIYPVDSKIFRLLSYSVIGEYPIYENIPSTFIVLFGVITL